MTDTLTYADIVAAASRLFGIAKRTPLQEVQAQYRSRERRDPLDTV